MELVSPTSPALAGSSLPLLPPGKSCMCIYVYICIYMHHHWLDTSYLLDTACINLLRCTESSPVSVDWEVQYFQGRLGGWRGLPWWLRWWRVCLQCRRPGFDPWLWKIPWRRERQPTPVFLPREFHGQRNLVGYSPWGHNELDMTKGLSLTQEARNPGKSCCSWSLKAVC